MRWRSGRGGEAIGRCACAGASVVRLRPSGVDVVLCVARWALGVAAAVVVMWAGAAFLATPASAAVTVPAVAVSQGAQKGGKEKPSGSGNGEKKDSEKKDSEKKDEDKEP